MGWQTVDKVMRSGIILPPAEFSVLIQIAWHRNETDGRCFPSIDTMARRIARTPRLVKATVASLRTKGVLGITVTGRRNQYEIIIKQGKPASSIPEAGFPSPDIAECSGLPGQGKSTTNTGEARYPLTEKEQRKNREERVVEKTTTPPERKPTEEKPHGLALSKEQQAGRRREKVVRGPFGRRGRADAPRREVRETAPVPSASPTEVAVVERFRSTWNRVGAEHGLKPMPGVGDPRLVAELAGQLSPHSPEDWEDAIETAAGNDFHRERLSPRYLARNIERILLDRAPGAERVEMPPLWKPDPEPEDRPLTPEETEALRKMRERVARMRERRAADEASGNTKP